MMDEIIVFVKAPIPGKVKTRLAPQVLPEESAHLYLAFVKDTLEAVASIKGVSVRVAYEPAEGFESLEWTGRQGLVHFVQEGNALGERLIAAFAQAFGRGAKRVVAIGSDSPGLPTGHIERALAQLKTYDVVLGPATDGGYYLVGTNRHLPKLFKHEHWSTPAVFDKTKEIADKSKLKTAVLPVYDDIDTVDDLLRLARRIGGGDAPEGLFWTGCALKNIRLTSRR